MGGSLGAGRWRVRAGLAGCRQNLFWDMAARQLASGQSFAYGRIWPRYSENMKLQVLAKHDTSYRYAVGSDNY